jgi:hypothetical protein
MRRAVKRVMTAITASNRAGMQQNDASPHNAIIARPMMIGVDIRPDLILRQPARRA